MRTALILSLTALVSVALMPVGVLAGSGSDTHNPAIGMGYKFGRGLSNAAFGWTSYGPEIKEHGALGLATGTAETIVRTSVGAVELGTFIIPSPTGNGELTYKPLMKPIHPWELRTSASGRVSQGPDELEESKVTS